LTSEKDPEKTRFLAEGLKMIKLETDENREKLIADYAKFVHISSFSKLTCVENFLL